MTENNWLNFYNNSSNTTNITVDGKASYSYNTNGYMTVAKDQLSGYEIRYTYSSGKVTAVQEYAGTAAGQKIGLSYYTGYTEVTNSGSDDVYGNADDIVSRYTFDKSGRAVGMYSTDSTKTQIYGATSGEYESDDKIKNNIKTATAVGGSATNYLLNGGFETIDSDGNASYWTKSSTNVQYYSSYDDAGGKYGAYFDIDNGRTDSIYQYTKLPAGTYTLSMSINTYNCKNVDVYVTAQSMDDSTHTHTEKVSVNEFYASGMCSFFSTTFDAVNYNSTGGEFFKIIILVAGGDTESEEEISISVDNVMLEENIGNSNYSLVQMGNFDKFPVNSAGTYLGNNASFWFSDSGSLTRMSASAPFGYTGYLSASITKERYLKQTVYEASADDLSAYDNGYHYGDSTKTYIVSGFAKGTGQVASPRSAFRIRVDVTYYMGSGNEDVVIPYYYDFQNDCKDWQFVCGNFETVENYLVRSIVIYCEYAYQPSGYAAFDNIAVVQSTDESVVKYEYYGQTLNGDKRAANEKLDGLLRSKKSGYYTEIYEYNDDRQLIRTANNRGEIHDYTYDTNGVDVKEEIYYKFTVGTSGRFYPYFAANPEEHITKIPQTKTVYTYNTYGELLSSRTYEVEYNSSNTIVIKSGSKYIVSSSTYNTTAGSKIFGVLLSETDSLGRKTRYYYNNLNGRLLAAVAYHWDAGQSKYVGDGTCYTYDAIGNVTMVTPATYSSSTAYTQIGDEEAVEYVYNEQNRLESITTDSTTYNFVYDVFGNTGSISIGSRNLAKYEYNAKNGKLNTINYGNGFSVRYVYDKLDNVSEIWYTNGSSTEIKAYEYTYTAYGQLYRFDNLLTGKSVIYKYDTAGKMTNFIEYDTDEMVNEFSSTMFYNDEGNLSSLFYTLDYAFGSGTADHDIHYFHAYTTDGSLNYYSVDTDVTKGDIDYTYDIYKRLTGKIYDFYVQGNSSKRFTNTTSYTFSSYGSNTSAQVATYTSKVGSNAAVTSTYTYDDNGNITKIVLSNGTEYRYVYDNLGQLIREDNTAKNRTYVYTYDNAGNILIKKTYALTAAGSTPTTLSGTNTYGYNDAEWGDLLTSFNGHTITYDRIGNPLSYYNGSSYSFTWENGRRLATATKGSYTLSFEYNDEGIRTEKVVNGVVHTYYLSGSQIEAETWGNNLCIYLYDADGSPIGMQYRTTSMAEGVFYTFWFEKNLQGDIVAVYNESGVKVCSYTYDAWGNFTTTWSNSSGTNYYARFNPFTYRGYYYDSETGFYYLQSRYYDPAIGRFISSDGQLNGGLLGYNQFAYCANNPIMNVDPDGHAWWHWALAATIVVACAVATVATCGGFAAAATAVGMVASGGAAFSTASTVAAAATIGSATFLGMSAMDAAMNSSSLDEFAEQGNWGTVAGTAGSAVLAGGIGYLSTRGSATGSPCDGTNNQREHTSGTTSPRKITMNNGTYTQYDNQGNIYSYTDFSNGRQNFRIDFQGKPHAGWLPHIHVYSYNELGQPNGETVYNIFGEVISK